jgi:hypothetical protein
VEFSLHFSQVNALKSTTENATEPDQKPIAADANKEQTKHEKDTQKHDDGREKKAEEGKDGTGYDTDKDGDGMDLD